MKKQIFVFGSNKVGGHYAGDAKRARDEYGAVIGVGEGRTGDSYAIPTKSMSLKPLSISTITKSVNKFIQYAIDNPNEEFLVGRIGCGYAGYKDDQISILFKHAPDNCILHERWQKILCQS
jgi:hypothetical protein